MVVVVIRPRMHDHDVARMMMVVVVLVRPRHARHADEPQESDRESQNRFLPHEIILSTTRIGQGAVVTSTYG
jgi:hypothetical protein